jgi:hypothetical protein
MIKPGSYRIPLEAGAKLTGIKLPAELKLARTDQPNNPIVGMIIRKDVVESVIKCLRASGSEQELVDYYVSRLEDGTAVPVQQPAAGLDKKHWSPGELFLKS